MRALALLPFLLLACGDDQETEDTGDTGTAEVEAVEDALFRYLTGEFDSIDQAEADSINYYAISLVMCPVDLPSLGERVLYVEQAVMDTPDDPYRQRFYVVESVDEDTAISKVYDHSYPHVLVGLCDDPASADITLQYIDERAGCGVIMDWDGESFAGGTEGTECSSTLGGATYATSEVSITADLLTSWDRGFDDEGQQMWGATKGAYEFVRRTPLE